MIALLIGGTVVFCVGILAVVFGIPIKEFSFGNTMILAGSVVSSTGLILIGLYFVGRELRNLAGRLDASIPAPTPAAIPALPRELPAESTGPRETLPLPPGLSRPLPRRPQPARQDTLFTRDQPPETASDLAPFPDHEPSPGRDRPAVQETPASWQDHPLSPNREPPLPSEEAEEAPAEPADRPRRRNIMFASHRRESRLREQPSHEQPQESADIPQPSAPENAVPPEPEPRSAFETLWPEPSRARSESPAGSRLSQPPADQEAPSPARERFQPPRRAEASPVTIVKSGVVDSMAYSLYSDGSIEAQMPEGMVRFASIEELRAHLEQRG